jgi:polyhydroxyalkanoate synthesis regulator phasin
MIKESQMHRFKRWWIAAAAALAITAVLGTGAVMAQEGTPIPGTTGGVTLLDRVAEKLGIDSATLRDAVKSSATDVIDERLAAGEITQEQADAMKARLAEAPDQSLIGGGRGFGGHGHGFGHLFASEELAAFLGITADELRTELQADGATLATVAEAHGQTRDALKAFLTAESEEYLDEAVAAGRLTQEEADAKLAEKVANLDAMIDGTMPLGGLRRGGPDGGFNEAPGTVTPEADGSSSS